MKRIKVLFFITAFSFSFVAYGNEDELNIEQKLAAFKMERLQAEVMIKKMVRTGRMQEHEAQAAKRAIASIKEEDVETLRTEALETLKSTNSLATK